MDCNQGTDLRNKGDYNMSSAPAPLQFNINWEGSDDNGPTFGEGDEMVITTTPQAKIICAIVGTVNEDGSVNYLIADDVDGPQLGMIIKRSNMTLAPCKMQLIISASPDAMTWQQMTTFFDLT